jgi:hypothetical protein
VARKKGVAPPVPVPAQIFTAKNVFISNGALDGIAFQTFRKLGDVHQPYNAFYAAMKEWGKLSMFRTMCLHSHLTIYDPKTALCFGLCSLRSKELFRRDTFIRNFKSRDRLGAGRPEKLAGHRG